MAECTIVWGGVCRGSEGRLSSSAVFVGQRGLGEGGWSRRLRRYPATDSCLVLPTLPDGALVAPAVATLVWHHLLHPALCVSSEHAKDRMVEVAPKEAWLQRVQQGRDSGRLAVIRRELCAGHSRVGMVNDLKRGSNGESFAGLRKADSIYCCPFLWS